VEKYGVPMRWKCLTCHRQFEVKAPEIAAQKPTCIYCGGKKVQPYKEEKGHERT